MACAEEDCVAVVGIFVALLRGQGSRCIRGDSWAEQCFCFSLLWSRGLVAGATGAVDENRGLGGVISLPVRAIRRPWRCV